MNEIMYQHIRSASGPGERTRLFRLKRDVEQQIARTLRASRSSAGDGPGPESERVIPVDFCGVPTGK